MTAVRKVARRITVVFRDKRGESGWAIDLTFRTFLLC